MALNPTDMTLQRLAVSLGQLVDQLQVTKSTKKDIQIEDVIKALNLTFKTTKGDIGELKSLLKVSKNTGNSAQYEKLIKMLELLVKSYDNPDVKQMNRLGITTQNLIAEISSLRDEVKSTNLKGNEKANLSLLSQAIADGQKQYALSGFGKDASNFYKKATLEQMRLLRQIDKHIDEGIPLKNLGKKSPLEKAKELGSKALSSGPLQAAADMVLKGMGFGTLPGEFLDIFSRSMGKSKSSVKDAEKAELQSMKVKGLIEAKEKSQLALDYNRTIQERAKEVKSSAVATKTNLTIELSKAIADAMRINEDISAKYAVEGEPGLADANKIADAIKTNSISKSEIESLLKSIEAKGKAGSVSSEELLKNFSEVAEYSNIIEEQEKIIAETAVGIQESIDKVAELFLDLREILGKELKNELAMIDKLISGMKNIDEETAAGIKSDKITRKLANMASVSGVAEDELHGIIGGESNSKYMREYEAQAQYGGKKLPSELARSAFMENSFRAAIYGEEALAKKVKTPGDEFEEKVRVTNERLSKSPPPTPPELQPQNNIPELIGENTATSEHGEMLENGLSLDEISDIVSESINEFLKNFEESMKDRDRDNKEQSELLRRSLMSGEVKVSVVNLKDLPPPSVHVSQGGGGDSSGGSSDAFGD
jgi:hypothetical protein